MAKKIKMTDGVTPTSSGTTKKKAKKHKEQDPEMRKETFSLFSKAKDAELDDVFSKGVRSCLLPRYVADQLNQLARPPLLRFQPLTSSQLHL